MKTFSKVLSMFLVVVMCFGLFATSAYATGYNAFNFGDNAADNAASDSFETNSPANDAGDGSFTVNLDQPQANAAEQTQEQVQEQAQEAEKEGEKLEATNTIDFGMSDTDTFDMPYDKMTDPKFSVKPNTNVTKDMSDTDANRTIEADGTNLFDGDTFPAGIAYSTSATGANLTTLTQGAHYAVSASDKLLIYGSWLKTLAPGTYFFYGKRTDDVPVKLGFITVNNGSFSETANISPSSYDKSVAYDSGTNCIKAKGDLLEKMYGFGVATLSGSYSHVLTVNEYTYSGTGANATLTLTEKYLDSLNDGEYHLIGFPIQGSIADQVDLGKFIVRSSDIPAVWTLSPDYQIWYSGTDPLTFYSDVFNAAGEGWNYKGYKWDVIVPDIRVSTRSNMAGATSVRIDQYWDLGYGYFMLGQNFLSSLSADETYYMQVIDARSPDIIYTNVVSFRVGPTLRAIDTDKHVINSTRSLRFRSSAPVSEVYVGNIQLTDPADFGVSWDGKTVTLSFEFLNKRSAGNTYTIKVRTTSGEWAATTFQVLTTAQGSASPRTGDESNLGLWAAFLLLSGTAVVVLVPKLKKQDF